MSEEPKLLPAGLDPLPQSRPQGNLTLLERRPLLSARNLEELTDRGEDKRSKRFREHISMGALCIIWILLALFLIATLCLAFHYLAPRRWGWLDQDQLDTLRTIVFSGAIISPQRPILPNGSRETVRMRAEFIAPMM